LSRRPKQSRAQHKHHDGEPTDPNESTHAKHPSGTGAGTGAGVGGTGDMVGDGVVGSTQKPPLMHVYVSHSAPSPPQSGGTARSSWQMSPRCRMRSAGFPAWQLRRHEASPHVPL